MKKSKKANSLVTLDVLDAKGRVIHQLRDIKKSEFVKLRRDMYRVLVFKLRQKVKFRVVKSA